jgi:hypothetical protein
MANHAPVFSSTSADASASLAEQTGLTGSLALDAASGTLAFADADLADVHFVGAVALGTGYLGSFKPGLLVDSTGSGSGSVGWTFSVADKALDFLAAEATAATRSWAASARTRSPAGPGTTSSSIRVSPIRLSAPMDEIADFTSLTDRIELDGFAFTSAERQTILNKDVAGFTGAAAAGFFGGLAVRVEYGGGTAQVYVDVDKDNNFDPAHDMVIHLDAIAAHLARNDFGFG